MAGWVEAFFFWRCSTLIIFHCAALHLSSPLIGKLKKKALYYTVIHQCSNGNFASDSTKYDYFPIVRFLTKVVDEALVNIEVYRTRYANFTNLSESAGCKVSSLLICYTCFFMWIQTDNEKGTYCKYMLVAYCSNLESLISFTIL